MADPGAESQGWIDCHDPFGRDRSVSVLIERNRVLLVAPPGESAVLSATQTRRLHRLLDKAADSVAPTADHPET
ncbi:hypothetical protein F0L68_30865 [Solihabitans fulvus]|uniref:Uncharacterized protein n=1 Tax=Solihabitans fulvus TaxID=1892852 RepID=A0A5B2WV33_9PSEU|nr:hypothetical protein [Solihabitans fulvus]KAA2254326.1 hypothetical protein F0L68_30865 [Solihabitans fulvus]